MIRVRRLLPAALVLMTALAAGAHGPRPRGQAVLLDPADPGFRYLATNVFGHYISHDGGESYAYVCPHLFSDGANFDTIGSVLVPGSPRALVIAGTGGIFRTTNDGCDWSQAGGPLTGLRIGGLSADPANPMHLLTATASGAMTNGLFESFDGGMSWEATSLAGANFFRTPVIHPESGRIYVTSFDPDASVYYLHRSDDGGATWLDFTLPDAGQRSYRIIGLHPDDDTTVFLRAQGLTEGDWIITATEGGASSTVTFRPPTATPIYETHVFPDGRIWAGREGGGAYESTDGGASWHEGPIEPGMFCFVEDGPDLLACGDVLLDRVGVSVSGDKGDTWSDWMGFQPTCGQVECPADASVFDYCPAETWSEYMLNKEFVEWGIEGVGCGGGGSGGGSCAQAPQSNPQPEWIAYGGAGLLAAWFLIRRRRVLG